MTRWTFMTAICAAAAAMVTTTTLTQAAEQERPSFETLDRDGSGEITRSEMDAISQDRFAANDTNGDGVLDKDELLAASAKRSEARIDRALRRMDTDGDGALSPAEMAGRNDSGRVFARLDTDGSGGVSKAEFEEGRAKAQRRAADRQSQTD